MTNKEIKKELQHFLLYAPEELQRRFELHDGDDNEFYFYGLIFRNEEVYGFDMVMFDKDDLSERYINLKPTLIGLLNKLNLLHSCIVLVALIDKYTREVAVVENNILKYLKYYDRRFKHKSTIHITKHRKRERKFIKSDRLRDDKRWNNLLLSTFQKSGYHSMLGEYKYSRPASFFFIHPSKLELIAYQNKYRESLVLLKRKNNDKN